MGKGLSGSWLVGREGLQDPLGQSSVLYISSHLAGSIRVRLSWHKLNQENLHLRKRHSSEILFFFFFFFLKYVLSSWNFYVEAKESYCDCIS